MLKHIALHIINNNEENHMIKFRHRDDEEIAKASLIEKGTYEFYCQKATAGTSKNGNNTIALELVVYDENKRERIVKDWLVDIDAMHYKIKHFCETTDQLDIYMADEFSPEHCINKRGYVMIDVRKDDRGIFVNKVSDYVKSPTYVKTAPEDGFNDAVPF